MKTASEMATSVRLTPGDTLAAVSSSPWTVHGWRPISLSSQPAIIAMVGSGSASRQARANHAGISRGGRGRGGAAVSQRPRTDRPTVARPKTIITRKDQKTTGRLGR